MIFLWALVQGCLCLGFRIQDLGFRARVIFLGALV